MSFIDMETYQKACEKARELVDPITLREAIYRVYDIWIADKEAGRKVIFHAYFGLSLLDLGIDELYEAEQYRKALAAYFQPRALKKLAKLRELRRNTPTRVSKNPVEFLNSMRVRIRINETTLLEFRATRHSGPLKWRHIDAAFKVIQSGAGKISDEDRHSARKQALAALKSFRERMSKKRAV